MTDKIIEILRPQVSIRSTKSCVQIAEEIDALYSAGGVGDVAIIALKKIANPIQYLQEEAEKEGAKLDGYMAVQLTKDANFYQEIAIKALKELNNRNHERKGNN